MLNQKYKTFFDLFNTTVFSHDSWPFTPKVRAPRQWIVLPRQAFKNPFGAAGKWSTCRNGFKGLYACCEVPFVEYGINRFSLNKSENAPYTWMCIVDILLWLLWNHLKLIDIGLLKNIVIGSEYRNELRVNEADLSYAFTYG